MNNTIDLQTRYNNDIYENPYSKDSGGMKDWAQILHDAQFETMTDVEKVKLRSAAMDWGMCACGNLCELIPRNDHYDGVDIGSPKDGELRRLGYDFNQHVRSMCDTADKITFKAHQQSAINTHTQIEKRALELLLPIWGSIDNGF